MRRAGRQRIAACVAMAVLLCAVPTTAYADVKDTEKKLNEAKEEKKKTEDALNSTREELDDLEETTEGLKGQLNSLNNSLAEVSDNLAELEKRIEEKQAQIEQTGRELEEAKGVEQEQYAAMKKRIQFMYEKGDSSYLHMFFGAGNMGDMVNKAKYVEELYDYDRKLLAEYEDTVKRVQELWNTLEEDKSELETSKTELQEGQAYMEELLAQKKEEYENYSVMLTKAKQEAATYTARIKQETAQIRKLEEEERKRREEEERKRKEEEERRRKEQEALLADGDAGSEETPKKQETPVPTSSGGGKGQDIANYACKFIGNPYVAGGTSLTNGADCSGFVMSVYKNFGINLPRSSYSQSTVGKGVSYSDARPGDVIYYGGHVGIYIGNGQIVHASTERTGIKITSATYRNIVTVRRIV